jgi:hypothetical protein
MNSTDIFKQLTINSLINSRELQEEVKSFIFYDRKEKETRDKKRGLINQLNLGLNYYPAIDGHWALSYRYERQLQAVNCICCGQFHVANREDSSTLPESMICYCDPLYIEEIIDYTKYKQYGIEVEIEYTDQTDPDWDYENNRYHDQEIVTIDYGISWLLS